MPSTRRGRPRGDDWNHDYDGSVAPATTHGRRSSDPIVDSLRSPSLHGRLARRMTSAPARAALRLVWAHRPSRPGQGRHRSTPWPRCSAPSDRLRRPIGTSVDGDADGPTRRLLVLQGRRRPDRQRSRRRSPASAAITRSATSSCSASFTNGGPLATFERVRVGSAWRQHHQRHPATDRVRAFLHRRPGHRSSPAVPPTRDRSRRPVAVRCRAPIPTCPGRPTPSSRAASTCPTSFVATAPCFTGFLAETRASQSVDATCKDFPGGSFNTCASITIVKDASPERRPGLRVHDDRHRASCSPASASMTTPTSTLSNTKVFSDVDPGDYTVTEGASPVGADRTRLQRRERLGRPRRRARRRSTSSRTRT